jgi:hypothetical protein
VEFGYNVELKFENHQSLFLMTHTERVYNSKTCFLVFRRGTDKAGEEQDSDMSVRIAQ